MFSPDGKEFYFSRFTGGRGYTIMVMREGENGWMEPEVAPFSGDYSEVDMFITHDGQRFFYVSKRPLTPDGARSPGYQIWSMSRDGYGWSEPVHLGSTVNMGPRQLYPTVAANGNLYFNSAVSGYGEGDFFKSTYNAGSYGVPENLGDSVNSEYDETDALIAPDERFLIFTSVGRADGFGNGDLYISFRKADGTWTTAKNMGDRINTVSSEFCPMLSPDGKYFFFTSRRNGSDDIFWVDASIIDSYRPS
ncbi:MAG: PD40 domain-containing protein [Gemmatimonadota bacterium]|nr:MAG: PD40 domain-containing protein [Gemmatimonadota bacterium]